MGVSTLNIDNAQLIKQLGESIQAFEKSFPLDSFQAGGYKQHPLITLLTCSDSRMPVEIFGSSFNHIFAVENIGNQFRTSAGSILYGLLHLHTPLMIVVGHTDCGAVKASAADFLEEPLGLRHELSIVKDSWENILEQSGIMIADDPALRYTHLAELNVDAQIDQLLANEQVFNLVGDNELLILGVMVDLHDTYQEGYGRLYTININGETDTELLKGIDSLGVLTQQARRLTRY